LEERFERGLALRALGHVERDRLGGAAGGRDLLGDRARLVDVAVAVDDHLEAASAEAPADRGADRAAAAGDERAPAHDANAKVASSTIVTRPSASPRPAAPTRKE